MSRQARISKVEQEQLVYKSGTEFVAPSVLVSVALNAFATELQATRGDQHLFPAGIGSQ